MFNIFKKSKDNNRLQVTISIDYKDNITINYNYDPNDTEKSNKLGMLLFCINNKLLLKHFVEALLDKTDPVFATEVVNYWSSFDDPISNNNDPIIKPLDAFNKNVK